MIKNIDSWIMGSLSAIIGLGALFAASRAVDLGFQIVTLAIFITSYWFILRQIRATI